MTIKSIARLLPLGLALSLAGLTAIAEEQKDSSTRGSFTLGSQAGTGIDDSSKLQQFEAVPKGLLVPSAAFSWSKGERFLDLKGSFFGNDDQQASLLWGKTDAFKLNVSWSQSPNWLSNTARSPYAQVSPGVFSLPDGMRQSLQNVYVPWIPGSASNPVGTGSSPANPTIPGFFAAQGWAEGGVPLDLRYARKTGKTDLSFGGGEAWSFKLSYSRESRGGNKNTTFYGGSYNLEVATPIDFATHDFRAEAEYAKGRFFANGSANFNRFANDVEYALIDNAQRFELTNPITGRSVINDVDTFRLFLPPDNNAWSGDFTAGVKLPKRHKLTAATSIGSMRMSQDLLPLSTNPNLATSATAPNASFSVAAPYADISARFDTFMGSVKFTGDPLTKLGYSLSYRKYQLDDKTDHYAFTSTVRGDVGPSVPSSPLVREHEGYSTESMKGEVHTAPVRGLRFGVSYGQDKRRYDRREYADVKDHNLTFSADLSQDRVAFHGAFTNLRREPGAEAAHPMWQGATQTDISKRDRHIWSGLMTFMPTDTLSISFSGQKQTNEFAESVTGLLDQSFDSLGADLTYAPTAKLSLSGGYVFEKYFFNMAAAYIPRGLNPPYNEANLWKNSTEDKVDTFRAGLDWILKPGKLDLAASFDYTRPRSDSQYVFSGIPGGLNEANGIFPANVPAVPGFPVSSFSGFPLVTKNFLVGKLQLRYHIDKNISASVLYWRQKFDNVDWQTATQPYMGQVDPGANRWLFLGAQVPSYDANIFRIAFTYSFF